MDILPVYTRTIISGHTFVFKRDEIDGTLLHIFARHRKEMADCYYVFFNGSHEWSQRKKLFITTCANEELHWFWIDEAEKVLMIVCCFNIK